MLAVDPEIAEPASPVPNHRGVGVSVEYRQHGVMLFSHTAVATRYAAGVEDWIGRQLRVEGVS